MLLSIIAVTFTAIFCYDFITGLYDRWMQVSDLVDAKHELKSVVQQAKIKEAESLIATVETALETLEDDLVTTIQFQPLEPVQLPGVEYKGSTIALEDLIQQQMPTLWSIAKRFSIAYKGLKKPKLVRQIQLVAIQQY